MHIVAVGKTAQGTDALGRSVASLDFPACRITSWDALSAIRSIVDTSADRVVRGQSLVCFLPPNASYFFDLDLTSSESATRTFRMSIDQFITNMKDEVPQAVVFEAHSLNVDHLTPFLE